MGWADALDEFCHQKGWPYSPVLPLHPFLYCSYGCLVSHFRPQTISQGRGKEGRTELFINDFYVLFLNQFHVSVCFGGFILFQERRGEGLKRKPTRPKTRWMQGQLGRAPFSTELCRQWAQKVTELAVSSTNHPPKPIITILLRPQGLVSSTREDTWGTPQQLHTREFPQRSSVTTLSAECLS